MSISVALLLILSISFETLKWKKTLTDVKCLFWQHALVSLVAEAVPWFWNVFKAGHKIATVNLVPETLCF